MTEPFSAAEKRILDSFVPPPMRAGFADRLTAQIAAEDVSVPRRRDPRGGWRRQRFAILGGIGAGLLSVGAAATGILGVTVQNMPVIASIAAVVKAPSVKAPPNAASTPKSVAAPAAKATTSPKANDVPEVAITADAATTRLADRIEARMRVRAENGQTVPGLPELTARHAIMVARGDPNAERFGNALTLLKARDLPTATAMPDRRLANLERRRAMFEAMTPEERERFRERQQQRQAARRALRENSASAIDPSAASPELPLPGRRWRDMTPEERKAFRQRRLAREAQMTPEQRAALQAIRAKRRERRMEAIEQDPREANVAPPEFVAPEMTPPQ
jgi:Spy/CpxP family protein refolding chaperone